MVLNLDYHLLLDLAFGLEKEKAALEYFKLAFKRS